MKSLTAALMLALGLWSTAAQAQEEPDPLTLAGEVLGFYYAMEEFDKGFCGPLDSGPFGADPAIAFLVDYMTEAEMAELHDYIDQNSDKDHAYFRGILTDNFRKRRGTNATLDDVCAEFEPIYMGLYNEAKDALRNYRR